MQYRIRFANRFWTDWQEEDTQLPGGNAHLWEESWDDDDTNEEFAVQLR
jgi:26 proteasome complex subunit DSS1